MVLSKFCRITVWLTLVGLHLVLGQGAEAANTQHQLKAVRQEIDALEKDISQQEKAKKAAKRSIETSEKALKKTRALVNAIVAQQHTSQKKLSTVYQNLYALQRQIETIQKAIAAVLQKQYIHRQQSSFPQWVTSQEAAEQTRIKSYYQYIAKAQQKMILQLQTQQAELASLSGQVKKELLRLNQTVANKKQEKKELEAKKNQQHLQEKKIAKTIQYKKQHLAKLLANEKTLSTLVARLQKQINAKKSQAPTSSSSKESKGQTVNAVADASASGKQFVALKGKMKLPMLGTITGKFGAARGNEGATWKGIFISSKTTQNVHVVADGQVSYVGYLPGLGKTSVVHHGGPYLTVYTGLSSISLPQGKRVKAGDILGQSGANLESGEVGLYFEIRQTHQPINPLSWIHP